MLSYATPFAKSKMAMSVPIAHCIRHSSYSDYRHHLLSASLLTIDEKYRSISLSVHMWSTGKVGRFHFFKGKQQANQIISRTSLSFHTPRKKATPNEPIFGITSFLLPNQAVRCCRCVRRWSGTIHSSSLLLTYRRRSSMHTYTNFNERM